MNDIKDPALVIVDMQNYYLSEDSDYFLYFNHLYPGSLTYISTRSSNIVIPNIQILIEFARERGIPLVFLRLCSHDPERKDLHHFFYDSHVAGAEMGFSDVYPLFHEDMADVIESLRPGPDDIVIDKTTFSPFSSTDIDTILKDAGIHTLVFTGLATSQCVETSARDASDRGYDVFHIHDAQADYDEMTHNASLFSSRGVCGGEIYDTAEFIELIKESI